MNNSAIATFCEDLKKAREYQRVSLADIAKSTRLSIEYLTAVETGNWDEIPSAYLHGYIGMYAQAVGMNREKVLQYYRQLTEPESASGGAVLNTTPPLVQDFDEVGLTRAKIAVPFFTKLASKKKMLFALIGGISVSLLSFALWTESSLNTEKTQVLPFEVALADYETNLHSAFKRISLDSLQFSNTKILRKNSWTQIICSDSGSVSLDIETVPKGVYKFKPYDTLEIEYVNSITLRISPSRSAMVIDHEKMLLPPDPDRSDSAIYTINMQNIEK